jgi:2-iminobutanoate/2-iminopropanoate deaminase
MKRILMVMFAIAMLGSSAVAQKAEKKSLGADLVPAGTPYSPAVLIDNTVYISGLQGTDQQTHQLPKEFSQDVKNGVDNIGRVLRDAGMDYSDVVSVQIFLVDMSQFQQVNSIYKEHFKTPFPSRTTVELSKLSLGSPIEIATVAHTP